MTVPVALDLNSGGLGGASIGSHLRSCVPPCRRGAAGAMTESDLLTHLQEVYHPPQKRSPGKGRHFFQVTLCT
jgi:hypothetical protein